MINNIPVKKEDIITMLEYGIERSRAGYGGPFSAMVYETKTGKVLAIDSNSVLADNDPTAHGEINAIRRACKMIKKPHLDGYSLLTSSEPCPTCMSVIIGWSQLDSWSYIVGSEVAAEVGFNDIEYYKKMQLIMRMKKVKSEYEKFYKYSDIEIENKIVSVFKEYKEKGVLY